MKTFREFREPRKHAHTQLVRGTTYFLYLKILRLSRQLHDEDDLRKSIEILSEQINSLSSMMTLSIGIDTEDKNLISKVRRQTKNR